MEVSGKPGLPLQGALDRFTSVLHGSDASVVTCAGVTMVFTGEMDQITRHEAEEKAKAAGAKVPGQTDMDRYRQMSLEILDR